jgi:hypothetical protein
MANFARSLPHNAINNPSVTGRKQEVNIEAQHQKWVTHLRHVQTSNRRTRTSLLSRINECSNLQVAILGSILTSFAIAITIGILIFLGFLGHTHPV